MTMINLTDLIPITHGEAKVHVDCIHVRVKRVTVGYRGIIKVEFPRSPQANYTIKVDEELVRTTDADATADAIALRKELIANNGFPKTAAHSLALRP